MDLDLLGAQSAAMAASGESCRRRGHAVVSLTDPSRHFAIINCRIAKGSFDHLIREQQERLRHSKAERLGGLDVQGHLKFDWQLNGKFRRLCPTENAIHVERRAAKRSSLSGP